MAKGGGRSEAHSILFDTFWETLKLSQLAGDPSHLEVWEIFLDSDVCSNTCYTNKRIGTDYCVLLLFIYCQRLPAVSFRAFLGGGGGV